MFKTTHAALLAGAVAFAVSAPALADRDDWGGHEAHERWEHGGGWGGGWGRGWGGGYYRGGGPVYVSPPYTPPPVYVSPPQPYYGNPYYRPYPYYRPWHRHFWW